MRLTLIAAAVVLTAAACSPQAPPPPSIAPADPPPGAARPFSVEVVAAREWLEGHTARCEPTAATGHVLRCVIDYRESESDFYAVVDVVSTDGSLVWLLEATVDVSGATNPNLARFDGFYGDTVLGIVASPEPRTVTTWLREHVTTTGSIDADSLMLDMQASPTRTALRIWQEP